MADQDKVQTKKPGSSAFKQQRLKAWQPILTPQTVLPTFFIVGLCFLPLGIGLFITSQGVNEIVIDYTVCDDPILGASQNLSSFNAVAPVSQWAYDNSTQICTILFDLPTNFNGPVFMYYRLTNFYQNHRRYVKSFSASQLQGENLQVSGISSDCDPLYSITNSAGVTYPIYPCGLIANSVFNDTFSNLTSVGVNDGTVYEFSETGIAWPSDKSKFVKTTYAPTDVVPPPNWPINYTLGIPDISQNEHLMVWMRTAGLPNFRKLYGRLTTSLPQDLYLIQIKTGYPVRDFNGSKSFVLSTTSWLGGKNPFLGIAYMVVGSLCLVLGIGFLVRHMIKPRKLGDSTLLSWNRS